MAKSKNLRVVGAGIAGLSAAYFLQKRGQSVTLYESSSRVGGLIQTASGKFGLVESAAPAFMNTAFLEDLCKELDLDMVASRPVARRNRFLENAGKVSRWPLGFFETLRCFLGVVLFKLVKPQTGQTVLEWTSKVFGKAAAQKMIAMVLQGIYGAEAKRLSAPLIFSRFYLRKTHPRKPTKSGSVSPRLGMQEFLNRMCAGFERRGGKVMLEQTITGADLERWLASGDNIVLAVPVWVAAELLSDIDRVAATDFASVPAVALESTTVFWDRQRCGVLPLGFGILFDHNDVVHGSSLGRLLGVLENDQIFESRVWGENVISETWISTGHGPNVLEPIINKRATLVKGVVGGLSSTTSGAAKSALLDHVSMAWQRAIPLFGQELESALAKEHSTNLARRGIYLVGNYTGQIGVAKIVERSAELATQLSKL